MMDKMEQRTKKIPEKYDNKGMSSDPSNIKSVQAGVLVTMSAELLTGYDRDHFRTIRLFRLVITVNK